MLEISIRDALKFTQAQKIMGCEDVSGVQHLTPEQRKLAIEYTNDVFPIVPDNEEPYLKFTLQDDSVLHGI